MLSIRSAPNVSATAVTPGTTSRGLNIPSGTSGTGHPCLEDMGLMAVSQARLQGPAPNSPSHFQEANASNSKTHKSISGVQIRGWAQAATKHVTGAMHMGDGSSESDKGALTNAGTGHKTGHHIKACADPWEWLKLNADLDADLDVTLTPQGFTGESSITSGTQFKPCVGHVMVLPSLESRCWINNQLASVWSSCSFMMGVTFRLSLCVLFTDMPIYGALMCRLCCQA